MQRIAFPELFATTGIRLVEGRDFDDARANTPSVAIVNRAMARRYFPNKSAIGHRFSGHGAEDTEIV